MSCSSFGVVAKELKASYQLQVPRHLAVVLSWWPRGARGRGGGAERWRRVAGGQPHVDGVPAEALGLERGHGPAAKGAAGGGKELR